MSTTLLQTYTMTSENEGQRLDVALASFLPGLSLREVRRLWEWRLIELNGKHARKGMTVAAGDVAAIYALPEEDPVLPDDAPSGEEDLLSSCAGAFPQPDLSLVRILKRENDIFSIFKPAGLHSEKLPGGRGGLSIEDVLPGLCEGYGINAAKVRLFNRLDCLTTGMVIACETDEAMRACEEAEQSGRAEKRYLALVSGLFHGEFVAKNMLDADSRAKTRVLDKESPDILRHTKFTPLYSTSCGKELGDEFKEAAGLTILQASICRGARHQIRAHLAHAGYPIWGDPVYNSDCKPGGGMYLHNFAVSLPGFVCLAKPVWPESLQETLKGLLPGLFPG